jgi:phage anti-repressor protein
MNELIKISSEVIGTENVNSVNARDLHKTLEIDKKFADWINHQINSLGLEKNVDYITYIEKGNGRPQKEYIITTDIAKHISMASRTVRGKEIRNYFIEIEKVYNNPNIYQLSGKIGGLTKSNNQLRQELDKWKKKSKRRFENLEDDVHDLKHKQKLLPLKNLDEKLQILFRKSDELICNKESGYAGALQNHNRFYREYIQILQSDGDDLQKWAINEIEKSQRRYIDSEKDVSFHKYRYEILMKKVQILQNSAKNIINFDIEKEMELVEIS